MSDSDATTMGSTIRRYGTLSWYLLGVIGVIVVLSIALGAVRGIATAQKGRAWIDGAVGNAARFVLELKAAFPAGPNDGP